MSKFVFDKAKALAGKEEMKRRCYACALENTPEGVRVVFIRNSLTGYACWRDGSLSAPKPGTRKALYIYLHECAHFALEHGKRREPRHVQEMQAEQWAHARMREAGIPVPRAMTIRAKAYVARKIRQAEKRGAKHIDPEARSFSKS